MSNEHSTASRVFTRPVHLIANHLSTRAQTATYRQEKPGAFAECPLAKLLPHRRLFYQTPVLLNTQVTVVLASLPRELAFLGVIPFVRLSTVLHTYFRAAGGGCNIRGRARYRGPAGRWLVTNANLLEVSMDLTITPLTDRVGVFTPSYANYLRRAVSPPSRLAVLVFCAVVCIRRMRAWIWTGTTLSLQ